MSTAAEPTEGGAIAPQGANTSYKTQTRHIPFYYAFGMRLAYVIRVPSQQARANGPPSLKDSLPFFPLGESDLHNQTETHGPAPRHCSECVHRMRTWITPGIRNAYPPSPHSPGNKKRSPHFGDERATTSRFPFVVVEVVVWAFSHQSPKHENKTSMSRKSCAPRLHLSEKNTTFRWPARGANF